MERFSALLALCEDNLPVTGEFPSALMLFVCQDERSVEQTLEIHILSINIALLVQN